MDIIDIAIAASKAGKKLAQNYVQYCQVMEAAASQIGADQTPTATIVHDGDVPVLTLGIPRAAGGVYIGETEPESDDYNVWINPAGGTEITQAAGVSF